MEPNPPGPAELPPLRRHSRPQLRLLRAQLLSPTGGSVGGRHLDRLWGRVRVLGVAWQHCGYTVSSREKSGCGAAVAREFCEVVAVTGRSMLNVESSTELIILLHDRRRT